MESVAADGLGRLLAGLPEPARGHGRRVLAAAASLDLEAGAPCLPAAFAGAALVVVEEGWVVVRASVPPAPRLAVTCEAAAGGVLLPPGPDEALFALGSARVALVSAAARDELLALPPLARRITEQLAAALAQKQASLANFAATRHVDRVRRKLLQLAGAHGHVVRDGIRIDFPISHALLAEMVGSSRETVTRALDALQRRGFVVRRGSTYLLLVAPESLAAPSADVIAVTPRDGGHGAAEAGGVPSPSLRRKAVG